MSDTPTSIELDVGANLLTVTWADGHVSRYSGPYLRKVCPCADCRGHVPGSVPEIPWDAVKDVKITGAEGVGTYAVRFDFSAPHTTGIYSFDWLRASCPSDVEGVDDVGNPIA